MQHFHVLLKSILCEMMMLPETVIPSQLALRSWLSWIWNPGNTGQEAEIHRVQHYTIHSHLGAT